MEAAMHLTIMSGVQEITGMTRLFPLYRGEILLATKNKWKHKRQIERERAHPPY